MGSDLWTDKRTEVGDKTTINVKTTTTIPQNTSLTITLFEDVGNDGTGANTDALGNAYDNSNSGVLAGGADEPTSMSGFDGGGSTNAYWLHIELDGDGVDPTLDSPTFDRLDVRAESTSATASITTQDAEESTVTGTRQVDSVVTTQDADQTLVSGTIANNAAITTQDADQTTIAGTRQADSVVTTQDAEQSTIAGTRQVSAVVTTQDADLSAAVGTLSVNTGAVAQDADQSLVSATGVATANLSTQDADQSVTTGERIIVATTPLAAQDADQTSAVGGRGITGAFASKDADKGGFVVGTLTIESVVTGQDADRSTLTGQVTSAAGIARDIAITIRWDVSWEKTLEWDADKEVTLEWDADREITLEAER